MATYFEKFYSNLFHASRYIDSRLQIFVRFVIQALILNNTKGIFDQLIVDLKAAYTLYYGNYDTKNISIAERMGATKTLDGITKQFADAVRSKYNAIAAVYPEGSDEYTQFFPNGLTEFGRLTRGNILQVANRFAVKADQYKDNLGGKAFADLFSGYLAQIEKALSVQTTKKTKVGSVIGDVINSREPVEIQLMKVMYKVGFEFAPDFVKCNTFFDFSLLNGANHSQAVVTNGAIAAKTVSQCTFVDLLPSYIFTLRNHSDLPFEFFGTHVIGGAKVGTSIIVPPQSEHVAPFAEFGAADMLYIYVKNDTDYAGDWEVRID